MCGIFAYIGDRQAVKLLVAALKRLEYRGYDSAGVGVYGSPLKLRKKVGKVVCLEEESERVIDGESMDGTCGIAHTRWATHGPPCDKNSHPHTTKSKSIAVVHNGVIENYRALKGDLTNKGYEFASDTDTELLAHLVEDWRKQMPTATKCEVVAMALSFVTGAYGVVFLFEDEPDLLIGARKGSPLLLGVGKGEYMLASDASAIIEHTTEVIYLREGELVEISRSGYKIRDIDNTVKILTEPQSPSGRDRSESMDSGILNPIVKLTLSLEQIEKGGYAHFMLKEIMDQPKSLHNAMRGRLYHPEGQPWQIKLGGMDRPLEDFSGKSPVEMLASAKRLIVCACGTSWHSGLIAKYTFESLAKLPIEVEYASEFRYRRPLLASEDIMLSISQSGETADTLEAIKMAKKSKCLTIGIVNVVGSSIARETDSGMYLRSGPEIGVASTKAFTGQVMALSILALQVAHKRGVLSESELDDNCESLNRIPDIIEEWLPYVREQTMIIAKYFRLASNTLFIGCGIQFAVALEGALKLKEISYIHAEGFPAAEIKHGALTLIQNFMPVVCIALKSDPAYSAIMTGCQDVKSKGASLIVITDAGNNDFDGLASFTIYCPRTKLQFEPLLVTIPLQLFSYYIADMRKCNIDQPRNLAKSVTVE